MPPPRLIIATAPLPPTPHLAAAEAAGSIVARIAQAAPDLAAALDKAMQDAEASPADTLVVGGERAAAAAERLGCGYASVGEFCADHPRFCLCWWRCAPAKERPVETWGQPRVKTP